MEREIIHRCGHAQRHHVGGYFVVDQDRVAARLANRPCPACLRADERVTNTARVAAARVTLHATALPPLAGSPRQVAWAERIRLTQLAALHRLDPGLASRAAAVVDARWWIDHRTADPYAMAMVAA